MSYQIEILPISHDLIDVVKSACDSLNKIQDEFKFEIAKENYRQRIYSYHRTSYEADEIFEWVFNYRDEVKGNRPYIIVIVNGFLSSKQGSNLFGTINKQRDTAIFTVHDFDQFVNDKVRFCRYYLTRYAINFLAKPIKSHDLETDKNCIFHYKKRKSEIKLSLDSGYICDNCRRIIQPFLTPDINSALEKLLLVVSNQHPYSIIFKGGGVKGLAFAGALLELEKYFSFDGFAGTSAGAIAAVLLGAGYKPSELVKELSAKNFKDFKDAGLIQGVKNLLINGGFFPGDEIENWINELLKIKIKKENEIRLSDLTNRTIVYASRIKDGTLSFDSEGERQTAHAAYAARCSMSIPFYFTAKKEDGIKVYDGGLRNNFPMKHFMDENPKKQVIGLYLKSSTKKNWFVAHELFSMTIDGEEIKIVDDNPDKIIKIDTGIIKTTNFKLSKAKKDFLVLTGRVAALEYVQKYHPDMDVDNACLMRLQEELRMSIYRHRI